MGPNCMVWSKQGLINDEVWAVLPNNPSGYAWMEAGVHLGRGYRDTETTTPQYWGAVGYVAYKTHEFEFVEIEKQHHVVPMNTYFQIEMWHVHGTADEWEFWTKGEHQKFKYEELVQSANAEELMGGVEDAAEGNETHGYIGGIEHLPASGGKWQPGWDFPNAREPVIIKGPDGRMAFTRFPTNAKFSFNSCR